MGGVYSALGLEAIGEAKAEQGFVILGGWDVYAEVVARGGDGALKEGVTRGDSKGNGNVMLGAFDL